MNETGNANWFKLERNSILKRSDLIPSLLDLLTWFPFVWIWSIRNRKLSRRIGFEFQVQVRTLWGCWMGAPFPCYLLDWLVCSLYDNTLFMHLKWRRWRRKIKFSIQFFLHLFSGGSSSCFGVNVLEGVNNSHSLPVLQVQHSIQSSHSIFALVFSFLSFKIFFSLKYDFCFEDFGLRRCSFHQCSRNRFTWKSRRQTKHW